MIQHYLNRPLSFKFRHPVIQETGLCQNQAAKSSDKRHLEWINRYKYYMIYHYVHMNSQFLTEKWYKALTNHHASLAKKNNSMWHLRREKNKTSIRFSSQKSSTSKLILTNASASPNTIDGSEIRRSPVDMENLLFLQGLIHPRWCKMSSINSISAEVQIHVENINHLSGYTRSLISLQR